MTHDKSTDDCLSRISVCFLSRPPPCTLRLLLVQEELTHSSLEFLACRRNNAIAIVTIISKLNQDKRPGWREGTNGT